jgi:hypothetical protein
VIVLNALTMGSHACDGIYHTNMLELRARDILLLKTVNSQSFWIGSNMSMEWILSIGEHRVKDSHPVSSNRFEPHDLHEFLLTS